MFKLVLEKAEEPKIKLPTSAGSLKKHEMVGWLHRLNGHEFEQAPGDSEGQGSLVCCSPCSLKESDMTE